MKFWGVLVLAAFTVLVLADSDVLEFNESNFASSVAEHDIILVEFYAPWCGHCKKLAPEYEKAATELKKSIPPVPLAKVDCTADSAVCTKYGVSGYPTLKIFRGGELSSDYGGPRQTDGIVKYMKKQSGPSSLEVRTLEAFEALTSHTEHAIVGFFADENSEMRKAFLSTAGALRDSFKFMHTGTAELLEKFGYNDNVVIFQPGKLQTKLEDVQNVYKGEPKSTKITAFVKENFMGLAGVRDRDNIQYFDAKKPLVVVYYEVDYERNPKGSNYWRNRVIKVAKEFVGQLTFSVSNKGEFSHEIDEFGGTKEDVFAGIFGADGKKYSYGEKKFSVDGLKEFATQFLNGELTPYVKSEPIPESNDGPVKTLVGSNFDEIVNDPTKDVLVEFYAPWCGHCKALAPKYDELGEKLKDDPNIVIAKMDATANDYPSSLYQVRGYPTIYWKQAGKEDKPEAYDGGREVPDFIEFIKKKATNPPVLPAEEKKSKKKKKKSDKEEL